MRWALGLLVLLLAVSCLTSMRRTGIRPPRGKAPRIVRLETTGYCPCGTCCGWKRNWLFQPVIASGPNKGKPKKVGVTSSGSWARPGTIAADTSVFPYGTVMHVPGYGWGRVEDVGSAIKGHRIDLFFNRHGQAKQWGRRTLQVKVWLP